MKTTRVVVTHALRTPIGKYLGGFASLSAADLGSALVAAIVERAKLQPGDVGEVFFGCGRQAGGGPNVARQVAVRGGLDAWREQVDPSLPNYG